MLTHYSGFAATAPDALEVTGGIREHRVSDHVRLWVRQDGLVVFDFTRWRPGKRPRPPHGMLTEKYLRRAEMMNCYSFALAATAGHVQRSAVRYVTPHVFLHFIEPTATPLGGYDFGSPARSTLPEDALDDVLVFFARLVANDLLVEGDLMARAIADHMDHAYGPGLVAAWSVAERLVYTRWKAYLDANQRRARPAGEEVLVVGPSLTAEQRELERTSYAFIDQRRGEYLQRWDVSRVVEILSMLDVIDVYTYGLLSRAREARNGWIHRLRRVDNLDAEAAFDAVAALMHQLYGLDFEIRVGGGLGGYSLTDDEAETERSVAQSWPWPPPHRRRRAAQE